LITILRLSLPAFSLEQEFCDGIEGGRIWGNQLVIRVLTKEMNLKSIIFAAYGKV
jgi:hypothetical protein